MERNILIKLENNGLQFYNPTNGRLLSLVVTPEAIRDGELVNLGVLELKLKTFLEENKITPTHIFFILSQTITFEKDFPANTPNLEEEIKNYVDSIPFENVVFKTYNVNNNLKLAVFNADLFEKIKNIFTNNGFIIDGVVPYFLAKDELNKETAAIILKNYDALSKESITSTSASSTPSGQAPSPTMPPTRLFILVSVFLVLFFLMVVFLIQQGRQISSQKATSLPKISPTVFPSPTLVATASGNINNQLTIRIQSDSKAMPAAQKLQSALIQSGFIKTDIETLATASAAKTTVAFATSIPNTTRNIVVNDMKTIVDDFVIQDVVTPKIDITISLE